MTRRHVPTFADYLVIAITPALIMLLVGSLAYFLIYAFYDGTFGGRLRYVASLYVLAVVLISRIAIERSTEYAVLFALPLALAAWLALARFTDAGPFVIVLILGTTWWAAHRLTWDCTVIDEGKEMGGGGLLQAAGLAPDQRPATHALPAVTTGESSEQSVSDASIKSSSTSTVVNWARRQWTRRHHPHLPGVWVVYFALITLPLFGLGQWAIPAADTATRRTAFHCLVVYVASALALLGTTCFLGLRRYLRQRKVAMPADMAAHWAAAVGGLILVVLLLCSVLPRPSPEASLARMLTSLPSVTSHKHWWLDDSDIHGEDGGARSAPDTTSAVTDPNQSDSGRTSDSLSEKEGDETSASADASTFSPTKRTETAAAGQSEPSGERSVPADAANASGALQPSSSAEASAAGNSSKAKGSASDSEPAAAGSNRRQATEVPAAGSPPRSDRGWQPQSWQLSNELKWLYWLAVLVGVGYLLLRYHREVRAALLQFWRDLQRLLQRQPPEMAKPQAANGESLPKWPSFASFENPFTRGVAASDDDLIRYTFQALEAWARGHGLPRTGQMTPLEFSRQLASAFPTLAAALAYFIGCYDRLAYAGGVGKRLERERIRALWNQLQAQAPRTDIGSVA